MSAGPEHDVRDRRESWEVVEVVERFQGRVVGVRSDRVRMPGSDGAEVVTRDVVTHPGSVGIVAVDDRDRILLIRQYRHPAGYLLWEVPAGLRDVPGEPLRALAERELLEEAGHRAAEWHTLVDIFSSPGMCDERIRVFLARGLTEVPADEIDFERVHEEADMPAVWVPLEEAVARVFRGDVHNPLAVTGILAVHAARATGYRHLRSADAPEG
ncbi:NUDIX domain-containing protein [Thermomonospora umbrina]|uniref:ADP-ribose pyrophosphatase n=1 Tax=Thermomonospora umbrina TaxID=111806 RepID=A0A3D9SW18_9ACTN|nr:NUDIX hydrolase [Thermomonospora umbrina]REE99797.1 ADP-ribose pyrophosphatase [Thermomonospora umbrina]